MLESWLDFHRGTLLWKVDGLTDQQLKSRPAPPSTLSLLGLIRHMTEVEAGWIREFVEGDVEPAYSSAEDPDADLDRIDDADSSADLAAFRAELEACRRVIVGHDLDETITDERGRTISLRWIYVHMIEEYARHNGHADLLREAIDGSTGD